MEKERRSSGSFFALMLIAIGALLLVGQFTGQDMGELIRTWWPALLLVLGLQHLFRRPGGLWGWFLLGAGGFFLARNLDYLDPAVWGFVWPALLVLAGVAMLLFPRRRRRGDPTIAASETVVDEASGKVKAVAVFAEQVRHLKVDGFQGGEATAVFGSMTLDLSESTLAASGARLEMNAVFGHVTLRLPANVRVLLKTSAVLGGTADRRSSKGAGDDAPQLVVEGSAVFGHIDVVD